MKSLAEFAIRRRWFVVAGWIVLIIVVQGIALAMGGPAYKDTFSLPHTETATVATRAPGLAARKPAALRNIGTAARSTRKIERLRILAYQSSGPRTGRTHLNDYR